MSLQRVSLVTLLYFFIRSVIQFLRQATNLLPAAVIFFAAGEQIRQVIILLAVVGLPLALLLHTFLSWWYFKYQVSEQSLHIRDGILKRKQLTLDFERIQQADVREPWYFRPFKLAILGVESAGSDSKEVELAGLPVARAYQLKEHMLTVAASSNATPVGGKAPTESTAAPAQPSFTMRLPLSEIARYGLIYNPILLLIPILIYPLSQADLLDDYLMPQLEALSDSLLQYTEAEYAWLGLLVVVLVALLVVVLLSVLLSIVRFYDFTLQAADSRYHAKSGLFSVTARSFQYVRLQRVVIQQGMIARLLRRVSVRVNQTGQGRAQQQDKVFFIPVLTSQRLHALSNELNLETPNWRGVHKASMIIPCLLSVLVISTAAWLISGFAWNVVLHALWISLVISLVVQWASWRRRGVFLGSHWLATRHGMIGQQQRFVPSTKIQALTLRQGPWLKLWGSATLYVYSAAGREAISWLPYNELVELRDTLLTRSATFSGRWM
ncbi:MAG: PH domain-containing protein [Idiomarina sp.]|nr:PH domain-containing protein [Idiomarina sp.]